MPSNSKRKPKGTNKQKEDWEKTGGGGFSAIPKALQTTEKYKDLSKFARALLVDFLHQYNGSNNGCLVMTLNHMKRYGWNSSSTITKYRKELMAAGYVIRVQQGSQPSTPSFYAITWKRIDDTKKNPAYKTSDPAIGTWRD